MVACVVAVVALPVPAAPPTPASALPPLVPVVAVLADVTPLLPVPVELDPIMSALLLDRLAFLHAHGLEIAEFGRNFFRIEAVPAWMEPADAEPFLRDLLGAVREGRLPDHNPGLAREELARLAAAKAIRLPATAGEAELQALAAQLFATRAPLTSPAGRPTYIELPLGELARR